MQEQIAGQTVRLYKALDELNQFEVRSTQLKEEVKEARYAIALLTAMDQKAKEKEQTKEE